MEWNNSITKRNPLGTKASKQKHKKTSTTQHNGRRGLIYSAFEIYRTKEVRQSVFVCLKETCYRPYNPRGAKSFGIAVLNENNRS
jgi:hypothetical protein